MSEPILRLARLEDANLVREISAGAYVPAYMATAGFVPKPANEDYSGRIATGEVWVAELGREPVGVLVLEPAPHHLLVYSIAVAPRHQGRGVGRALLILAEECARKAGLPELRLYTNERLTRNLALYQAVGFTEVGRRPHPSRSGEGLVDMMNARDNDSQVSGTSDER